MEDKYPIAETFYSLQGEGLFTGTPMHFIRLAGCNVGQYLADFPKGTDANTVPVIVEDFKLLAEKKHSICTTSQGERFICDTDYHMHESRQTAEELLKDLMSPHVCITGGEPFMYDLEPIWDALDDRMLHIETSGTLPIPEWAADDVWITCAPKKGFLLENFIRVSEFKFLAGPNFNPAYVHDFLGNEYDIPIYIQPINSVHEADDVSVQRAIEIVKANPGWKLSAQLHKYWRIR